MQLFIYVYIYLDFLTENILIWLFDCDLFGKADLFVKKDRRSSVVFNCLRGPSKAPKTLHQELFATAKHCATSKEPELVVGDSQPMQLIVEIISGISKIDTFPKQMHDLK